MEASGKNRAAAIYALGANASVAQAPLFALIGVGAFIVGIDRIASGGLEGVCRTAPVWLGLLSVAFLLIALLGFAITPAERLLVGKSRPGLAAFGTTTAIVGHAGTIAFFSWWLLQLGGSCTAQSPGWLNAIFPLSWGLFFELGLVGLWVWIFVWTWLTRQPEPRGFLYMSVFKGLCFWFTWAAFVANSQMMIGLGVALTTLIAGPAWHLWIARLFRKAANEMQP